MNLEQRVAAAFREGMTYNELHAHLQCDGGNPSFSNETIRRILSLQGKRVKRDDFVERLRERYIKGMSVESLCGIMGCEANRIYYGMRRLGLSRPKLRHRMSEVELLVDQLLYENAMIQKR